MERRSLAFALALSVLATSAVVLAPERASAYTPHAPIRISSDADFTIANGVVGGNGVPGNPYVISGWEIVPTLDYGIWISNTNLDFSIESVHVNRSAGPTLSTSIKLTGVSHGNVRYSWLEPEAVGILVESSTDVELFQNNVTGSPATGARGVDSSDLHVAYNTFGGAPGLQFVQATGVFGYENEAPGGIEALGGSDITLFDNRAGITLNGVRDAQLNGNEARASGGIRIQGDSGNITVSGNRVHEGTDGIVVENLLGGLPEDVRILGNDVENNSVGVLINSARSVTVAGNRIANNRNYGLQVVSASYPLVVHHNNFLNNSVQAEDVVHSSPPDSVWDSGYPSGGNYWSNYTVADTCGGIDQRNCTGPDGFGDVPYVVGGGAGGPFPYSRDRYPRMTPFGNGTSPVASFVVSPSNGTTGPPVRTVFLVDASSAWGRADLDPLNLEIQWDWEADGIPDTPWTRSMTDSHVYTAPGNYTIILWIRGPDGQMDTTSRVVRVTAGTGGGPTPVGNDWLLPALVFLAILIVPPVALVLWRRRRAGPPPVRP